MAKLLKPCSECPWRRSSIRGWLGASTPREFLATTMAEHRMPCHKTIDYERPDWKVAAAAAPLCVGSLVFLANICKIPRDPDLAAARMMVAADREEVFSSPSQFLDHHSRETVE